MEKKTTKKQTTTTIKKSADKKATLKKTTMETTKKYKPVIVKKEKNVSKNPILGNDELGNLVKIVLAVLVIFLVFYGLTVFITENKKNEPADTGDIVIQYDEILLGTLFEQPASEYYVLANKEDDVYLQAYTTYITSYKSKENSIRVYTTSLDSGFNKNYVAEESHLNTNNLQELKLKGTTLLKIKDKKIVASYEGNAKIIEHLKNLIK